MPANKAGPLGTDAPTSLGWGKLHLPYIDSYEVLRSGGGAGTAGYGFVPALQRRVIRRHGQLERLGEVHRHQGRDVRGGIGNPRGSARLSNGPVRAGRHHVAAKRENHPVARMLPRVITHTENEVFHSLQKGMFLFNLIGLVIEPHVFHRSTLLSCDCLHDQAPNGLASGISRVAQRCSYEGRGRTVGKVDSVHVDGKYIERTLVEGAIGVVECAECPCHSVAIKVSHRFVPAWP